VANLVNDMGKKAVHQGLLSEDEARDCLQNARRRCNCCCGIEDRFTRMGCGFYT
jgi:hypothetical protein